MATKLLAAREWGAKAEILGQRAARTFRAGFSSSDRLPSATRGARATDLTGGAGDVDAS
jgi:hypothetical protein